jgi:ATP-dependent exoDNAse (exonuclease V) alpha subunit
LITPRHNVRERWNEAALAKHCEETGNRRYVVNAEDRQTKTEEEISLNIRVKIAGMEDRSSGKLNHQMEIAVGMKTMVTQNISTEAGIANGTRGIITDIILDPREPATPPDDEGAIHLKYPPAMVLFKPDHGTTARFRGIDPGVVPITPSTMTFTITTDDKKKFGVKRRQLPITPGYAFTDYKSQGQTIEYVIIDIGRPPSGNISPFSIYVALSRSRGRDTIRLLRDFDDKLFTRHPSEDLRKEMLRLERFNEITKATFEM